MADKKVLCFEIGSQKIRICEVDYMRKNPRIYKCITLDTPEGSVEDGYIKDKHLLVDIVKKRLSEEKVKNHNVVFTINSTKIANREVTIPMVKPNMIQSVIDVSAVDYFPVDVSEYSITYSLLEKINTKEEKKLRLLLLAAPNYLIKNYYEFAKLLDLEVVSLDYSGNSTFQLMKKQVSEGVSLVVQISEQTSQINIIDTELLILQRTIPFGTSTVLSAVIESEFFKPSTENEALELLVRDELLNANFDISAEESALSMADTHESYDKIYTELKGKEEITNSIKYLVNNVNRVVDYYNSKYPERKIKLIYLTGQGSKFRGIGHLFQNEVGIELRKIENLFSVVFQNRVNVALRDQADYLSCIGASMSPVGFVLKDELLKKQRRENVMGMAVVFGVSIVAAVTISAVGLIGHGLEKSRHKSLQAKIEKYQGINEIFANFDIAKANYDRFATIHAGTTNQNNFLNEFIEQLEGNMPNNMIINSFTSTKDDITFTLKATNKDAIAKFLIELKEFKSVDTIGTSAIIQQESDDGIVTVSCTIKCTYTPVETEGGAEDAE